MFTVQGGFEAVLGVSGTMQEFPGVRRASPGGVMEILRVF